MYIEFARHLRLQTLLCLLVMMAIPLDGAQAQNKVVVIPMFDNGPSWMGPWAADSSYRKTNVVEFGGSSYIALQDHTADLSNMPPDENYWGLVAAAGANGMNGAKGDTGDQGIQGVAGMNGADGADGAVGPTGPAGPPGADAPVPPTCTGAYRTLQFDGTTFSCVTLTETGLSAGMANGFEIVDSWGDAWDGFARSATTWNQANAACQAVGARLPTTTELWRANHLTGTGEIGPANDTTFYWTIIPRDGANVYYVVRLSNGTVSPVTEASSYGFRCVWPSNTLPVFAGNRCYGPPGDECFATTGEGGHYNVDKFDRPAITASAATRECAMSSAHLPSQNAMAETIQAGLPNGSEAWLWTSDHEGFSNPNFYLGLVRWTDVNTAFDDLYTPDASWSAQNSSTFRNYRCAGLKTMFMPYTGTVANAFVDPNLKRTSSTQDSENSSGYLAALDNCRAQGGHLPYQRDLHELIVAGLPNGSNQWLWTADVHGAATGVPYTGIVRWSGTDMAYTDRYTTYATWANRNTASHLFRCVYYPIDENYTGPGSSCAPSGIPCFSDSVSNGTTTTNWMDVFDRAPASYGNAVRTCSAAGGHLPTHRDMAEMIRAGLPNGSNIYLWTSDHTRFDRTAIVRWDGTDSGWADIAGTDSTISVRDATLRPYRCTWSNELSW